MTEDDAVADEDWFERAITEGARDEQTVEEDGERSDEGEDGRTDARTETGEGDRTDEDSVDRNGPSVDDPDLEAADPEPDELDAVFEAATESAASDASAAAVRDAMEDAAEDSTDAETGAGHGVGPGDAGDAGEGDLFEDDFATAFESGGDDEFGDEDFESDIPRIDVGIEGLDRMIQGGVPERHLMVAIGSAGTGKTTFGLQYLNHGLEAGQNGVYITLEQSHDSIVDTAAEHGWDFERYEAENELAVVDLDPIEMANSLDNIRSELPTLIEEFDADRFVLDSVSLLEMMYDEQARRRTEIFDFTRSLKRAGVTTLLTSEAAENTPYASRHGIIEYLTDAVFVLQYVRGETNETRLAVEIQKIRNANHSRETKPYEITDGGISVYEQANIF